MRRELIVNFSDPHEKRNTLELFRELQGKYRIEIRKHRPRRSDRQNRYYWPCFVQPFGDYLRGQGHVFSDENAHAILREMFLKMTVLDKQTGQELTFTRSTTDLDTDEFNEYLEQVAAFLANECGFAVASPSDYREQPGLIPNGEQL